MRTTSNLVDLGSRYALREAYVGDAFTVLRDLREADRLEWDASVTGGARENLALSIWGSQECYAVLSTEDDTAHIIFGVVTQPEPTIWLLGTNQGQREASWILHQMRDFIARLFERWPSLVCYSAPENTVHHRWLLWVGFRFTGESVRGDFHRTFLEFRRRDNHGHQAPLPVQQGGTP